MGQHNHNNRGYYYDIKTGKILVYVPDYAKGLAWDQKTLLQSLLTPLLIFIPIISYSIYRKIPLPMIKVSGDFYALVSCMAGLVTALLLAYRNRRKNEKQVESLMETDIIEAAFVAGKFRYDTGLLTISLPFLVLFLGSFRFLLKNTDIIILAAYTVVWFLFWILLVVTRLDRRWKVFGDMKARKG